jgi:hypothetical protein
MLRRTWHLIAPCVIGSLVLIVMSQLGNEGFDASLIPPAVLFGSLAGYTARCVKLLRPRLGAITTWVAVAAVWSVLVFIVLRALPSCPVEAHPERCSTQESSLWGVNVALLVLVLSMVIEPPRAIKRVIAAVRSRRRR